MTRKTIAGFAGLAALSGAGYLAWRWKKATGAELARLAAILGWQPGAVFADVGAGRGRIALYAARRVGPDGGVFATEVDPKKAQAIRARAAARGLTNVSVISASQDSSGLPPASCDSVLMRGSYHHLTDPRAMNESLFRALRPGGTLAIVDFAPRWWLTAIAPVEGVPPSRGGHGVPPSVVTEELTAAGFELERTIPRWFLDTYCLVFRRPA